jgi:ATP-binding cassette, subfamily B, bacterial PglK
MVGQVDRLWALLQPAEKRRLWILLGAMAVMGLLEVIGVSSIFPFIAVVAKPETVQSHELLRAVYERIGFASPNRFLFFLGLVVLAALFATNLFAAFVSWLVLRFSHGLGHSISVRLLRACMDKPYVFFLARNTSTLTVSVIGEVSGLVNGVVVPALQTIAKLIVAVMLLGLLMVVDPWLATCVALAVGGIYASVFAALKARLTTLGNRTAVSNRQRHRFVVDALHGIKELRILHREPYYLSRFDAWSRQYAQDQVGYGLIAGLPRYVIEIIAFGGILVILLYLIALRRDLTQALPLIALYAVAGYRLMPAVQQIFGGIAQVRFSLGSLQAFYRDLEDLRGQPSLAAASADARASFDREVALRNVSFTYPGAARPALESVTLSIPRNTTVGIVGTTGSGKSTAIDLLLGLHEPQTGALCLDGVPLPQGSLGLWQRRVGYVPQAPYLIDDSVRRNVALGVPDEEIDDAKVLRALELANLSQFVERELAHGLDAQIGERGARLSGGQRQRLCIARALYHDPDVLVFDEATSALDANTEDAIIEAIRSLSHRKTIVMIAHKLASLADCDRLYVFEQGRIIEQGTYAELREGGVTFRALARFGVEA